MKLKPARSLQNLKLPDHWNNLLSGRDLLIQTNQLMQPHLQKMFGYHLLKLGSLSEQIDTSASPIKHQFSLTDKLGDDNAATGVYANLKEIPLQENSVDCVLISLACDFSNDPHQIMREANRILIANGHLIYVGLNPLSIAGLRRISPIKAKHELWKARFFSKARVTDWLNLLGFEVIEQENYAFSGFYRSDFWLVQQWQRIAKRYLPWSGSMYFLVAKKREVPLSLIKPKWKLSPQLSPAKVSLYSGKQNISG